MSPALDSPMQMQMQVPMNGAGTRPPAPRGDALAGRLLLQPGQGTAIAGGRPIVGPGLLGQLLRGQQAAATQARLGHVFSLCAHAHQRACALAFGAACATLPDAAPGVAVAPLELLRWETARDHLRAIALDWPERLGEPQLQAAALEWMRSCPLPLAGHAPATVAQARADLAALRGWLAQDADFPARCLALWHAQGRALHAPLHALAVLHADPARQEAQLRALAALLATEPDFPQRPHWQGTCAETGPWTRLRHGHAPAPTQAPAAGAVAVAPTAPTAPGPSGTPTLSAWARLEARWQDLQDLADAVPLSDGATHDPLLSSGALALGEGQAIAWCEMARGLLVHWLQLDATGAVAQYRVLSPTEWNFHPQGALAQALAAMAPQDHVPAQTLAAAFDACVECSIADPTPAEGRDA